MGGEEDDGRIYNFNSESADDRALFAFPQHISLIGERFENKNKFSA